MSQCVTAAADLHAAGSGHTSQSSLKTHSDSGWDNSLAAPVGCSRALASCTAAGDAEGVLCGAGGDLEEQKEWLQDFLNEEFEKAGWGDGSIAWQDVAKRKSDLSNNEIFQVCQLSTSNSWCDEHRPALIFQRDERAWEVCC